jgi:hypothetical protein
MHKGGLAHHARRAADATADANLQLVELRVRPFEHLLRGAFTFSNFGFVLSEILDNRCDGVFNTCRAAALKLVRIGVADELAQLFKVLCTRLRLVVLFDERDAHRRMVNSK